MCCLKCIQWLPIGFMRKLLFFYFLIFLERGREKHPSVFLPIYIHWLILHVPWLGQNSNQLRIQPGRENCFIARWLESRDHASTYIYSFIASLSPKGTGHLSPCRSCSERHLTPLPLLSFVPSWKTTFLSDPIQLPLPLGSLPQCAP